MNEAWTDTQLDETCEAIIPVLPRLVARPWGGEGLAAHKGGSAPAAGVRYGEAFEVSAWDADPETAANPSEVTLPGGVTGLLTELLDRRGAAILGPRLAAAHGSRLPLLPKVLSVRELLSVQAHPPGRPEVYIVLDAEPGATIRLGWRRDVDPASLTARLERGRALQSRLQRLAHPVLTETDLARLVSEELGHGTSAALISDKLCAALGKTSPRAEIEAAVDHLRGLYWETLDLLNDVPVRAGQILYNAAEGSDPRCPDAEVHALGNPEGRQLMVLEVRLPGTTYRAWDHCRFPMRPVDVATALASMPLSARRPESFFVEPRPLKGYPNVRRSVENNLFVIDHLELNGPPLTAPGAGQVRTLHALAGHIDIADPAGRRLGELRRGQCALAPAQLGPLVFSSDKASVVQVTVPSP